MKTLVFAIVFNVVALFGLYAQSAKPVIVSTNVKSEKHLSSSILLWMLSDTTRQALMDRWKGPHAQIIAANKGLWEYRQIHFTETNSGLWPAISGVETNIPQDRRIDGVADVTLKSLFSIPKGKEPNKQASADEVNLFKRTILYAAFSGNSSWYEMAKDGTEIDTRSMVFFRRKEGVSAKDFENFIKNELTPTLANLSVIKELRSKIYNPWKQKQWNTPNVLHDNEPADQFHASLILGFTNQTEMEAFFKSDEVNALSERIALYCSAVEAYEIAETITFVKEGEKIN